MERLPHGMSLGCCSQSSYEGVDTFTLNVDITDLELEDRRPIGVSDPFSPMHEFGGLAADDGENGALRVEFDIVVVTLWRRP